MWGQSCVSPAALSCQHIELEKVGVEKFQAEVWPSECGRRVKGCLQGGGQRTRGGHRERRWGEEHVRQEGCAENKGVDEAGEESVKDFGR